ncbi:PREDICTED: leucine-rich repeat flightless-interacting protein 2-like [Ceratosolen solmsi marchali]|uniref:Leucine-rich repeat flightless-interacting protein 2-like n=1 Tax=Ceratosolen solmsi marchali TaxID=326594 RepID=A0AAJ6YMQ8_9HYME|nr:PREDICTED: leucine-rich repeat flightless-interacting protein 2-like [Ceratosolen solmsi marchali]
MFTNIFIIILLSTQDNSNFIKKENVDGWWKDLQQAFQRYYEQSKNSFDDTLNEIKRRTLQAIEMGKEKFSELQEKYNEIQDSNKTLDNEKNVWESRLEELKDQSLKTLKNINEKYEQLKKKTENVIKQQQEIWQTKIKELVEDIRKIEEKKTDIK